MDIYLEKWWSLYIPNSIAALQHCSIAAYPVKGNACMTVAGCAALCFATAHVAPCRVSHNL
jgi:hypothetical protein